MMLPDTVVAWSRRVVALVMSGAVACIADASAAMSQQQVVASLQHIGFGSEQLSALGLTGSSVATFAEHDVNPALFLALHEAEVSVASAHSAVFAAEHAMAESGLTSQRAEALGAARGQYATATANRDARTIVAREHLVEALEHSIGTEAGMLAQRTIGTIGRDLPSEWRFLELSPEGFATLERAARKARLGRELTEAEASVMAAAETSPIVTLARGRIEANAAAIREMFSQALPLPPAP